MTKRKYITTDCFKVGDFVWVTGFKVNPSGTIKYQIRPTLCQVEVVSGHIITVSRDKLPYYAPYSYCLYANERGYSPLDSLDQNVALTKEEAIKNYNQRIIEEIENKYDSFRRLEYNLKLRLL